MERIRSRLASRKSVFGGPLCTRELSGTSHWLQFLHSQNDAGMSRQADSSRHEGKVIKKKSIVPKCYPKNGGSKIPAGGVEHQASEKSQFGKGECLRQAAHVVPPGEENRNDNKILINDADPTGARNTERGQVRHSQCPVSALQPGRLSKRHAASSKERETNISNDKENTNNNQNIANKRLTRKGSFYGNAQPPSALVPLPPRQSYSDQSECESLIDDAEVEQDDFEWVKELRDTLGRYIEKDFSEIDRLPDRRMQASFDQMMEEEANTCRIGLAIDRREAARESALARKRRKRKRRLATALVISECNDDDDDAIRVD
eukprot:jgi/Picsp_1/6568/NSC_03911-R1_---NA---